MFRLVYSLRVQKHLQIGGIAMRNKAEAAQFSQGYKSQNRLDLFHVNLLNN